MTALIWDAATGEELHRLAVPGVSVYPGVFSPNGTKIVLRCDDNTARIWEVESGKLLRTLTGHTEIIDSVTFSSDGKKIATTSSNVIDGRRTSRWVGSVRIWDVESGKELHKFAELQGGSGSAHFSPDGKKLVTVVNSIVRIRDVAT
jgi:WD40 repeat protein